MIRLRNGCTGTRCPADPTGYCVHRTRHYLLDTCGIGICQGNDCTEMVHCTDEMLELDAKINGLLSILLIPFQPDTPRHNRLKTWVLQYLDKSGLTEDFSEMLPEFFDTEEKK